MTSDIKRQIRDLLSASLLRVQLRKNGDTPRKSFIDTLARDIKVSDALQKMFLGIVGACPVAENAFKSDPQLGDFRYLMDNWSVASDQQKGCITNFFHTLFDSTAFKKLGSRSRIELELRRKFSLGPKKLFMEPMPTQGGQAYYTQVTPSEAPVAQHSEVTGNAIIPNNLDPLGGKGDLVPVRIHPDTVMSNQAMPIPISIQNATTDISSYRPDMFQTSSTSILPDTAVTSSLKMQTEPQSTFQPDSSGPILGKRKYDDALTITRSKLQKIEDGLLEIHKDKKQDSSGMVDITALNPTVFQQTQQSANTGTPGGTPGIPNDRNQQMLVGATPAPLAPGEAQSMGDTVKETLRTAAKVADGVKHIAETGTIPTEKGFFEKAFDFFSPRQGHERELRSTEHDSEALITAPKPPASLKQGRINRRLLGLGAIAADTASASYMGAGIVGFTVLNTLFGSIQNQAETSPPDFKYGVLGPIYQMLREEYGTNNDNAPITIDFAAIKGLKFMNEHDYRAWRDLSGYTNGGFAERAYTMLDSIVNDIWTMQNDPLHGDETLQRYAMRIVELSYITQALRTEYLRIERETGNPYLLQVSVPPLKIRGTNYEQLTDLKMSVFGQPAYRDRLVQMLANAQLPGGAGRNILGSLMRVYHPFDEQADTSNIPYLAPEQFIETQLNPATMSPQETKEMAGLYADQFDRLMKSVIQNSGNYDIKTYEPEKNLRFLHRRSGHQDNIDQILKNLKTANAYNKLGAKHADNPYNVRRDPDYEAQSEQFKFILWQKMVSKWTETPLEPAREAYVRDWETANGIIDSKIGTYPASVTPIPQPPGLTMDDQQVAAQDGRAMRPVGGGVWQGRLRGGPGGPPTPAPTPTSTPVPTVTSLVPGLDNKHTKATPAPTQEPKEITLSADDSDTFHRIANANNMSPMEMSDVVDTILAGLRDDLIRRLRIHRTNGGVSIPTEVLDWFIKQKAQLLGLKKGPSPFVEEYLKEFIKKKTPDVPIIVPKSPTPTPQPDQPVTTQTPAPQPVHVKPPPTQPPEPEPNPNPQPNPNPNPNPNPRPQQTMAPAVGRSTAPIVSEKDMNYDPVLTPVQVPNNNNDLPTTGEIPGLNPMYLVNGDKVITEMHDDPMNKIINTLAWESFVLANQEPNQEPDNPLNILNFVEEVNRFTGELEGDNWFGQQCIDAVKEDANEMSELIENIPPEVAEEGQAIVIDTISGPQHAMSEEHTDSLFHDVFLPSWLQIPKSSPWQQFTQPEGSQLPDSMIEDNDRWAGNDWPLLATENRFIYNIDA